MMQTLKNTTFSIVIPTLNEEGFIEDILNDIIKQDGYLEIIVSDSGSDDGTEQAVKMLSKQYPEKNLQFIRAKKRGVAIARNNGALKAKGTYIIFLDADNRIPASFLKNVEEEILKRKLDAAGCYQSANSKHIVDRAVYYLQRNLIINPLQYTKRPFSLGAGIIIKRSIHKKIGGFDRNIHYGEDLDYIHKIYKHGLFRMLKSTNIKVSTRRFVKEGRTKLIFKYCVSGLCYILNIKNVEFEYEFGNFSKGKKDSDSEKTELD